MAVTFVSENDNSTTSGTSITVTAPTGIANGDLLIAAGSCGPTQTFTKPTGWTQIDQTVSGSNINCGLWWKVAASESGNYTWTLNSSSASVVAICVFRGVDTGSPINQSGLDTTGTSHSETSPGITTTATSHLLYMRHTRTGTNSASDVSCTASGTGITERADAEFNVASPVSHGIAIYDQSTDQSSGSKSGLSITCGATSGITGATRTVALTQGAPVVKTDGDTGSGTEGTTPNVIVSASDSATGTESAIVTVASDFGTGTDAAAVKAVVPNGDTAAGAESVTGIKVTAGTDNGLGTENAVKALVVNSGDSGLGTEGAAVHVVAFSNETATGTEGVPHITNVVADAATGVEHAFQLWDSPIPSGIRRVTLVPPESRSTLVPKQFRSVTVPNEGRTTRVTS